MIIKRIEIDNFGCFSNRVFEFGDRFNVLYGLNGAGKSTLMAFIKMMFYSKCSNEKSTDLLKTPRKKYRPWNASVMSGAVVFEHDGCEYRLHKEFNKSPYSDVTTLWNITRSETLSLTYPQEAGELFFGMSSAEFERSIFIERTEGFSADVQDFGLETKINNLSLSGDENISQQEVLKRLTVAKEELISKSGKKGLIVSLENELSILQSKKDLLAAQINEQAQLLQQIKMLEDEISHEEQLLHQKELAGKVKLSESELNAYRLLLDKHRLLKTTEDKLNLVVSDRSVQASSLFSERVVHARLNRLSTILVLLAPLLAILFALSGFFFSRWLYFGLILSIFPAFLALCLQLKSKKIQSESKGADYETLISDANALRHDIQTIADAAGIDRNVSLSITIIEQKIKALEDFIEKYSSHDTTNYTLITPLTVREKHTMLNELYRKQIQPAEDMNSIIQLISQKTTELKELRERHAALCLAESVMKDSISDVGSSVGMFLSSRTKEYLSLLGAKNHSDVLVTESLDISLKSPDESLYRQWKYLSQGNINRIYFALRLALSDAILSDKPISPLFLDDVFSSYDDESCKAAMFMLKNHVEGEQRQVLFFTCHKNITEFADNIFSDLNKINL